MSNEAPPIVPPATPPPPVTPPPAPAVPAQPLATPAPAAAQPLAPAVPAQPLATPAPAAAQPPAPTDTAPVPYTRFAEVNAERKAAAEKAATLEQEKTRLEQELASAKREVVTVQRNMQMEALGGNLKHPQVKEYVSSQYEAYASKAGKDAKPFEEWLAADARANPLLTPHFPAAAPLPPGSIPIPAPAPAAPPPPNPNGGTVPVPPASQGVCTPEQIAAMGKNPQEWGKNREAVKAALRAQGKPV